MQATYVSKIFCLHTYIKSYASNASKIFCIHSLLAYITPCVLMTCYLYASNVRKHNLLI